ncbi:hypothetical protein Syun_027239 [Stephania yunnanensis]|uniref:Uncharacterized protein n=1 Tax=Stephania yunnanensis TaxID=152371 RepID=A0AAP0EKQ9_9MAGN
MVLKKKNGNIDAGNGGSDARTHRRDPIDHWGFLEEIDAAMWVDLTLESEKMYQDIDDNWFRVTHMFHENLPHDLIAQGLPTSVEGKASSDIDFVGSSSPKLPSSVSRSRGKDFISRNWRGDDGVHFDEKKQIRKLSGGIQQKLLGCTDKPKTSSVSSKCHASVEGRLTGEINQTKVRPQNLRHASSWRPSFTSESSSAETMNPRLPPAKLKCRRLQGSLSLTSRSIGESNLTSNSVPDCCEPNCSVVHLRNSSNKFWNLTQTNCGTGGLESTLTLDGTNMGGNNSASSSRPDSRKLKSRFSDFKSSLNSKVSNVTESSQQGKQKAAIMSCQIIGRSRRPTSSTRINLPNRSTTSQTSKIEVKDRIQIKDAKSSSSEANVAFSSNSDSNSKNKWFTVALNQDSNSERSNPIKMDKPSNQHKGRDKRASKASNGSLIGLTSRSKVEGKDTNIKRASQEVLKAKVLDHCECRETSSRNRNVQSNGKECVLNKNQLKANGPYVSIHKTGGKENNIGIVGRNRNDLKLRSDSYDKGVTNQKEKPNGRSKLDNQKKTVRSSYFR